MKKMIGIIVLSGVALFAAGCGTKGNDEKAAVVQTTTTTEAPVVTTTTEAVETSCSKVVTAARAWEASQGPSYSTNGGFEKYLTLQSAMSDLADDWNAPSSAMLGARMFQAASGIPTREVLDVIHYCTAG